jgi:hypothetical protein
LWRRTASRDAPGFDEDKRANIIVGVIVIVVALLSFFGFR